MPPGKAMRSPASEVQSRCVLCGGELQSSRVCRVEPVAGWRTGRDVQQPNQPTRARLTRIGAGRSSSPMGTIGEPPSVFHSMPVCSGGGQVTAGVHG